jgi:hypothetical protein
VYRAKNEATWMCFMPEAEKLNFEFNRITSDLAKRIAAPRMTEFEDIWQKANAICDRYGLGFSCLELPKAA